MHHNAFFFFRAGKEKRIIEKRESVHTNIFFWACAYMVLTFRQLALIHTDTALSLHWPLATIQITAVIQLTKLSASC